jgi:small subunit ribosomal protein S16
VAPLGSYNPHTKTASLDKEKASYYLEHGAQPTERVARLLKAEGVKLPNWVKAADKKAGKLRNPDKLRKNRPAEEVVAEPETAEVPSETAEPEVVPAAEAAETPADEAKA